MLWKRKEGAVPPSTKWQRLNDSESGTRSEAQSVEPQLFHPSLDWEDKEEFKFEAPNEVGSYLEQHFKRNLTKEQLNMLRKHPKPGTKVMVPPKLHRVSQTNKG